MTSIFGDMFFWSDRFEAWMMKRVLIPKNPDLSRMTQRCPAPVTWLIV